MQIGAINSIQQSTLMPSNTDYNAARASAEAQSFQSTLDALTAKANNAATKDATSGDMNANSRSVNNIPPEYENKLSTSDEEKRAKELMEACKGFESMFLNMMYRQMRATVPENTLFGTSNAIRIFEDMRDTELMSSLADAGGIGIADMMYKQLSPKVNKG